MIQIVPALPPANNGVGDYGFAVARAMRNNFGVQTQFVVGDDNWDYAEKVDGFTARRVGSRSAQSLAEMLSAAASRTVLLQLSGYGYSARGCPFWLLQGLQQWKRKQPERRLITMFHELYACAPPWRKTFWAGHAQRMVIAGIARLSDAVVTNLQAYRCRLEGLARSPKKAIDVLAVPSNVGEPVQPSDLSARTKSMVVFGLPASRQRAYAERMGELQKACERLGITEVQDVGGHFEAIPGRIGRVPVSRHGSMSACELSALLSQSMAGFVAYSPGYMAKSGVFAAYCAHRMLPVMPQDGRSQSDGIRCGTHYYNVGVAAPLANREPQAIADLAWEWYQGHSLQRHATVFATSLK